MTVHIEIDEGVEAACQVSTTADPAEHPIQGDDVLAQQDLVVLERSGDDIAAEDADEVRSAERERPLHGLAHCTQT